MNLIRARTGPVSNPGENDPNARRYRERGDKARRDPRLSLFLALRLGRSDRRPLRPLSSTVPSVTPNPIRQPSNRCRTPASRRRHQCDNSNPPLRHSSGPADSLRLRAEFDGSSPSGAISSHDRAERTTACTIAFSVECVRSLRFGAKRSSDGVFLHDNDDSIIPTNPYVESIRKTSSAGARRTRKM